jgi:hypothetical protein
MRTIQIAVDCGGSRKDYELYTHKSYDGDGHEAHWHERVGLHASKVALGDILGMTRPGSVYPTEREAITAAFLGCLDHADQWEEQP